MLDHLVYLVPDLPQAVERFTALGLPPTPGGRHPDRGTHNALLRLGPRSYLELLAPDPRSTVAPPRWMGIDLPGGTRISRWAASAGAIPSGERVQSGSRRLPDGRTLRWSLTDPGTTPSTDVIPFLIDWGNGPHPADDLPDMGLRLHELRLYHPDPDAVNRELERMGIPQKAVRGPAPKLEAVIRGPDRELIL